jgi:hypothetical protein
MRFLKREAFDPIINVVVYALLPDLLEACGRRPCVSTMQPMDAERRPANMRRPR